MGGVEKEPATPTGVANEMEKEIELEIDESNNDYVTEEENEEEDEEGEELATPTNESDDEDVQEMINTLQKIYKEVCSPPTKATPNSSSEPDKVSLTTASSGCYGDEGEGPVSLIIEENWESSDNESSTGNSDDVMMTSLEINRDMFDKLEKTRSNLENVIGLDSVLKAYTLIQVSITRVDSE